MADDQTRLGKRPGKPRGKHPQQALSVVRINSLNEPGLYADGMGLYLKVDKTGSKRWIQRVTIRGKRTDLGLGGYPLVSLAEARRVARENKLMIRAGEDPRQARMIPSFADAAKSVYDLHKPTWRNPKHGKQWWSTLEKYAFPVLGKKRVDTIAAADVLAVLLPIWTAKPETSRRVRQRISAVLRWAIAQGWRVDNPAESIVSALPSRERSPIKHHRSLPYEQVAAAIERVRKSAAHDVTKLVFEFMVLTAARSGEARGARWSEIEGSTWTIPGERMKTGRPHRVPLSDRAMEILEEARALGGVELVFPSVRGKVLTDVSLSRLLRELNIDSVPHGFRSSFRNWAAEQTGIPHQVCEFALAHVIGNKAEAAYMRSDLFEKRRALMQMWADYLARREGADVIPLRAKKQ